MQAKDPVAAIREAFPDAVQEVVEFRGETTVYIDPPKLADVAQFLHDADGLKFNFLVSVVGVDYLPESPRFAVAYHLYSMLYNANLRLKVRVEEDEAVPSVTPVWPTANWQEREVYDMFGIPFDNHPDLRRILMPEDWDGYPQRKDYPLGYETVQFSFNYDEIDENKPYARE
jgi:NADH-quinone oxidoreductase subunit C